MFSLVRRKGGSGRTFEHRRRQTKPQMLVSCKAAPKGEVSQGKGGIWAVLMDKSSILPVEAQDVGDMWAGNAP